MSAENSKYWIVGARGDKADAVHVKGTVLPRDLDFSKINGEIIASGAANNQDSGAMIHPFGANSDITALERHYDDPGDLGAVSVLK